MKSFLSLAAALSVVAGPVVAAPKVCAECVKTDMARLAGPEARGRACGAADEHAAARYVADRLKAYGIAPAAAGGGHLQEVRYSTPTYAQAPTLSVGDRTFTQGGDIVGLSLPASVSGALVVMTSATDAAAASGKVVVLDAPFDQRAANALLRAGALAVIAQPSTQIEGAWSELGHRPPPGVAIEGVETPLPAPRPIVFARPTAFAALKAAAGQTATLSAPRGAPQAHATHNVLGVIRGTSSDADKQAILLSAHYDHVGVKDGVLYPGANDDASGTTAVLEFARMLSREKAPKRTIIFALFGCEEQGGHGSKLFQNKPPLPLADIAANLQFEMIGLPDPNHPRTLMLTGWERSNLGPTLKAQGADLGPDPYPEQNFFQRSDNYALAVKGVVAHTVSAWPLTPTYHQPTDTIENLDLGFMTQVIQSLIGPIQWLANSDFRPEWNPGMKP